MRARTAKLYLDRAVADVQAVLNVIADANADLAEHHDDEHVGEQTRWFVTQITGWAEQGRLNAEKEYG